MRLFHTTATAALLSAGLVAGPAMAQESTVIESPVPIENFPPQKIPECEYRTVSVVSTDECLPPSEEEPESPTDIQGAGLVIGGGAAANTDAIEHAVGNATENRGGNGAGAARLTLFPSTMGGGFGGGLNVWVAAEGTDFSGVIDGDGQDLTFGVDFEVAAETYLGLFINYGEYDVIAKNTPINNISLSSEVVMVGAYVSTMLPYSVEMDAFLGYGSPEYVSGGTSFDSDRLVGGFSMSKDYAFSNGDSFTGFGGVTGYSEDLPGVVPGGPRTISSTTGIIGGQYNLTPNGPFRPYASFSLEANNFDDGAGGNRYVVAPRYGVGFDADFGSGTIGFDIANQSIFDGARSTSGSLTFSLSF